MRSIIDLLCFVFLSPFQLHLKHQANLIHRALYISAELRLPSSSNMLYTQGAVSSKPWKPIFNVRGRPAWVQTTVFDFLKQLKVLRTAKAMLPTIDTVTLPSHRQVWVPFGKMEILCDGVVSAPLSCSRIIADGHLILRSLGIHSQ